MNPHVFDHRALGFESSATHFTLKLAHRIVNLGVLLQLCATAKGLLADGTLVFVREVDQIPVPEHMVSQRKHEVALGTLDVHGLLLMGHSNMGLKVTPGLKLLATKVTLKFLWRWQAP